jgi:flagellar biogenesis protein FliO
VTILGALGLVLGIFLLTAWGIRRAVPQALHPLPKEVFEVLGRAPLAGRQQAQLLRLGNKLVLVSLSPAGAETLTEITDPLEVDRVAGLCRQAQPGSATAVFRQVLDQFAPRRPSAGEVGRIANPSHQDPRVGLTANPSHDRPDVGRIGDPSYENASYGPAERRRG